MAPCLHTRLRFLARDRRGVSALEFGLIAGVLATILLSVWDIGNAMQQEIRLEQALRAAAQYAQSFPTDTAGITAAVTNAVPAGWSDVSVAAPSSACYCASSGSAAVASPGCTCPSGETLERFLTLGASRPYSAALLTSITTLSGTYVLRYQ